MNRMTSVANSSSIPFPSCDKTPVHYQREHLSPNRLPMVLQHSANETPTYISRVTPTYPTFVSSLSSDLSASVPASSIRSLTTAKGISRPSLVTEQPLYDRPKTYGTSSPPQYFYQNVSLPAENNPIFTESYSFRSSQPPQHSRTDTAAMKLVDSFHRSGTKGEQQYPFRYNDAGSITALGSRRDTVPTAQQYRAIDASNSIRGDSCGDATHSPSPWGTAAHGAESKSPASCYSAARSSMSTQDTCSDTAEDFSAPRRTVTSTTLPRGNHEKLPVWERLYQEASTRAQKQQATRERVTLETKILSGGSSRQFKPEEWDQKWKRMMERHWNVRNERQRLRSHLEFQQYLEEKKECIFRPMRYSGTPMTEEESNLFIGTLMELQEKQKQCKEALEQCQKEETLLDAETKAQFITMLQKEQSDKHNTYSSERNSIDNLTEELRQESQKRYAALMERRLNLLHEATAIHNAHYQWLHLHGVDKPQYEEFEFDTGLVEQLQKSQWFQLGIKCFPSLKLNAAFSAAVRSQPEETKQEQQVSRCDTDGWHLDQPKRTRSTGPSTPSFLDLGFPERNSRRPPTEHKSQLVKPRNGGVLQQHPQRRSSLTGSIDSTTAHKPSVHLEKAGSEPTAPDHAVTSDPLDRTQSSDPRTTGEHLRAKLPTFPTSQQHNNNIRNQGSSHSGVPAYLSYPSVTSVCIPRFPSHANVVRAGEVSHHSSEYTSDADKWSVYRSPLPLRTSNPGSSRIYAKSKHIATPQRHGAVPSITRLNASEKHHQSEGFWMNILQRLLNGGRG